MSAPPAGLWQANSDTDHMTDVTTYIEQLNGPAGRFLELTCNANAWALLIQDPRFQATSTYTDVTLRFDQEKAPASWTFLAVKNNVGS